MLIPRKTTVNTAPIYVNYQSVTIEYRKARTRPRHKPRARAGVRTSATATAINRAKARTRPSK